MTAYKANVEMDRALHALLATHLSKPGEPDVFLRVCGQPHWLLDLSRNGSPRENADQIINIAHRHGLIEDLRRSLFQEVSSLEKSLRVLRIAAEGVGTIASGPRILVHNQHLADLDLAQNPAALVRVLDQALEIVAVRPWEPDYWPLDLVNAAMARAVGLSGLSPEAQQMMHRVDREEAETLGLLRAGMPSAQLWSRQEKRDQLVGAWGEAWPRLLEVLLCRFRSFHNQFLALRGLDLKGEVDAIDDELLRGTAGIVRCFEQVWGGPAEGESWDDWSAKLEQIVRQDSPHRLSSRLQIEAKKVRHFHARADRSMPTLEPEGDSAWAWRWRGLMAVQDERLKDAAQAYLTAVLKSQEEREPVCLRLWTIDSATEATLAARESCGDEVARLTEALSELSGSIHAQEVHELRLEETQVAKQHAEAVQTVLHGVRNPSQRVIGGSGVGGRLRTLAEVEGLHPAIVAPWAQAECWTRWSQRDFNAAMEIAFRHGLLDVVRAFVRELQHTPVRRECLPWIRSWAVHPRHRGELYARAEALATLATHLPDSALNGLDRWVLDAVARVGITPHHADQDAHLAELIVRSVRTDPGRLGEVWAAIKAAPVTEGLHDAFRSKILIGLPFTWKTHTPTREEVSLVTEFLHCRLSSKDTLREARKTILDGMRGLTTAGFDPWDSLSESLSAWLQRLRSLSERAELLAVSPQSKVELLKVFDQAAEQLLSPNSADRNDAAWTLALHGHRCIEHLQRVAASITSFRLEPHPRARLAAVSYRAGLLAAEEADSVLLDCMDQDFQSAEALGELPEPPPRCRERAQSRLAGRDAARATSLSRWGTSPELGVLHALCCRDSSWVPEEGLAALVSAVRLGNAQEARLALSALAGLIRRSKLDEAGWSAAGATVAWAQRDERLLVFTAADQVAGQMRIANAPPSVIRQLIE